MNTHLGLNRSPWLTRRELSCIPSPTTLRALLSLLCCPPSAAGFRRWTSPVWTSPLVWRLAATHGRNVFALLRTASSPQVALHPASRRRSYLRLPGVGISRERTCTSQIAPAPKRTYLRQSRRPGKTWTAQSGCRPLATLKVATVRTFAVDPGVCLRPLAS